MTTILPKDDDNNPIPALRLKDGKAHKITATFVASKNSIPFDASTKVVSVFATEDIFIEFGDPSIVATTNSHFFPSGVYYDFAINTNKNAIDRYISIVQAGESSGYVYISEKE
jgi:hypothetical protein